MKKNMTDPYLFYPVVVIGAGPAGSACGIRLLKSGLDCCLIERSTFPRVKLCAGVLTAKSREVLAPLLGPDSYEQLMAETLASSEGRLRLWQRSVCFVDCDFTQEDQLTPDMRKADCRIHLVDRPRFDTFLAHEFRKLGGELIEGDGCEHIDFDNKTMTLQSGQRIGYNVLVAADGAVSHTEHLLHHHDPSFRRKAVNSTAFELNVSRHDLSVDGVNIYFGFVPDSYAWAFAKGNVECIGLCKLRGKHFDAGKAMRDFCTSIGMQHQERYGLQGAMIPIGNPLRRPLWHNHVYFIGDAAGLNEPLTGEGIYYALESGVRAAVSIAEEKPKHYLADYDRLCRLIRKGSHYQQLVAHKPLFSLFHWLAARHPRFVGYFYQTQIEHASLNSFMRIVADYLHTRGR